MSLQNVRDRVRRTLETKGLSQRAFCDKHDISDSWLNKFLCGVHTPRYDSLEKLEAAIDKEVLEGKPS